jgi:hypothetical protein
MKKLYFIGLSFFAGLTINAQVLTQSNNAPMLTETFRTTDVSTVGVLPGSSGNGVTWDMSAISLGTTVTVYSVVPVPSASTAAYPSASVAVQNSTTGTYNFYSSSSTDLKYWGGSVTVSTVNVNMNYSSAAVLDNYSMVFGSTGSNTVAGTIYVPAFTLSGTFTGTCTINADGLGTLALPTRTFTNVLRKKTIQDLAFTTSFGAGTIVQNTFEYFASSLAKSPLFTISTSTFSSALGTSSQTLATVNTDFQYVGVKENVKEIVSLNIFPNPAKNNFNLSFVNENSEAVSFEIINTLGQTIKKENLVSTKGTINQPIDISNIETGVYFVKVNVGARTSTKKLTIQ